MWVDIHTHKSLPFGVVGFQNIDNLNMALSPECCYSFGIHPWQINDWSCINEFNLIAESGIYEKVKAVGECGFDNIKGDKKLQSKAFKLHIEISEGFGYPLIIHNVGANHKIWEFHKKERPLQPWILHGFMGNTTSAEMFIRMNLYCSFSLRSLKNPKTIEAFKIYPPHLTFLETDDDSATIEEVYTLAASILEKEIYTLKDLYYNNFKTLFELND